jgi:hypothetical protein
MKAGKKALRRMTRADAPLWLRMWSFARLVVLLGLMALAATATIFVAVSYLVSLVSRSVRS